MNGIQIQNGNHIGVCDSRCWSAKDHRCDCPCQGRHHGKGVEFAMGEMLKLLQNEKRASKKGWQPGVRIAGQLPLL